MASLGVRWSLGLTVTLSLAACGGPDSDRKDTTTTGGARKGAATTGAPGQTSPSSSGGSNGGSSTGGGQGATTSAGTSTGACPQQGQPCTPANGCDVGAYACGASGGETCQDQGPASAQNGVPCDAGMVCDEGACRACNQGGACPPANACDLGAIDCSTGAPVCKDEGAPNTAATGQPCADGGGICDDGACQLCGGSCTPFNLCNQGQYACFDAGVPAYCVDDGTPDDSADGTSCGFGLLCGHGACDVDGGTPAEMDGGPQWVQVPNENDGVIPSPNIVLITYDGDPDQTSLQQFAVWLADGGYLPTVASQYGVGNGTAQLVNLTSANPAPTGTTTNQNAFPDYFSTLFQNGVLPANNQTLQNDVYVLTLPASWADTDTFCQSFGGYHTYYNDQTQGFVIYAIVPNCEAGYPGALQEIEVAISHEVIEASTDPLLQSWVLLDPENPWTYLGGEVGDLCASNTNGYTDGPFIGQLIWSNAAAAAGQVPCQPWPPDQNYFSLVAPNTMATAAPGGTVQVQLTGWASLPSSYAWAMYAEDGDSQVDFSTNPQLSTTTMTAGATATVTLTIPSTARAGEHGAAWIYCYDPVTYVGAGSAMVGVTVQ